MANITLTGITKLAGMREKNSLTNIPCVSIIICTYNRAESLGRYCLPALINLTYKNFETIVVMDACTDNTINIVSSYISKLPHLSIINNPKSKGISYVRNLGIKHAEGEIIAFIDDDCVVSPAWMDGIVKSFISSSNVMAILGKTENRTDSAIVEEFGGGGNMAFRKIIFKKFLFDRNLYYFGCTRGSDIDFMKRLESHRINFERGEQAKLVHLTWPAAYRKIIPLSNFTNGAYLDLKRRPLLRYYFFMAMGVYTAIFFRPVYRSICRRLSKGEYLKDMVFNFPYYLHKVLIRERNIMYTIKLLYFILLDIQIRAKIKHIFEEIYFRLGVCFQPENGPVNQKLHLIL